MHNTTRTQIKITFRTIRLRKPMNKVNILKWAIAFAKIDCKSQLSFKERVLDNMIKIRKIINTNPALAKILFPEPLNYKFTRRVIWK